MHIDKPIIFKIIKILFFCRLPAFFYLFVSIRVYVRTSYGGFVWY